MGTFKEFISEAKAKFEEVNGIRVIPKSFTSNMVVYYDEIDRTDGTGRSRKGTPHKYEIERFEEYGIDGIEYMKKSDFPFSFNFKTKEKVKVTSLVDHDDITTYKQKGLPTNSLRIFFSNDNFSFLIHKEDVEAFLSLETKDEHAVFKATE
jgi:hypothetical protein